MDKLLARSCERYISREDLMVGPQINCKLCFLFQDGKCIDNHLYLQRFNKHEPRIIKELLKVKRRDRNDLDVEVDFKMMHQPPAIELDVPSNELPIMEYRRKPNFKLLTFD